MWYLIKFIIAVIYSIIVLFFECIYYIGSIVLFFKIHKLYTLEEYKLGISFYDDYDNIFPVFNRNKLTIWKATSHYNYYLFKNYYHYIWGL